MNEKKAAQTEGRAFRIDAGKFVASSTRMLAEAASAAITTEPSDEIKKSYRDFLFDMTKEQVKPDFRLSIQGIGLIPAGSITAVTGWAKQGKTQFLTAIASVMLSGRDFGSIKRGTPPKGFLWCDTEQSHYNIQMNMNRLYHQMGVEQHTPSQDIGLHILSLRPCSAEERLSIIQQAIDDLQPEVIVIDGIRDLLHDFNDISQSEKVMQWLLDNCAAIPNRNIFVVIHTNDGTEKMRGNLGTELANKCEDRFTVTKKNGGISVSFKQGGMSRKYFSAEHIARGVEMPDPFNFRIDENGYLTAEPLCDEEADTDAVLREMFKQKPEYEYTDLCRDFAKYAGITQIKAKDILKGQYMDEANGLHLVKNKKKKWTIIERDDTN